MSKGAKIASWKTELISGVILVELRARLKVKMKIAFTKKERVLKSPYYLCNKLWDQLDHTVQNLSSCFEFTTVMKKMDSSKLTA